MMISFRNADLLTKVKTLQNVREEEESQLKRENLGNYPLDNFDGHEDISDIAWRCLSEAVNEIDGSTDPDEIIEHLPHESGPGFWCHIDGGLSVQMSVSCSDEFNVRNKQIEKMLDEARNSAIKNAEENFFDANKTQLQGIAREKINYHDLVEMGKGDLAEQLSEVETEYLSDLYFNPYIKIFYYAPGNTHRKTKVNKPEMFVHGGIKGIIQYDSPETTFTFSTLTELRTKLDASLAKIVKSLQ